MRWGASANPSFHVAPITNHSAHIGFGYIAAERILFYRVSVCIFLGLKTMGFSFGNGKQAKTVKFIRAYIKERVKEKRAVEEQLKRLDVQRKNKEIDKSTYERLRAILQINFLKQREETLEKARISGKIDFA